MPPTARRSKKINAPRFDARPPLSRLAGVDLTTIEGSEAHTALVLLRALGTDLSRWPRVQHGSAYVQQGLDAYETQYRERKVTAMAKQAKAVGYTLVPLAAQGS